MFCLSMVVAAHGDTAIPRYRTSVVMKKMSLGEGPTKRHLIACNHCHTVDTLAEDLRKSEIRNQDEVVKVDQLVS